MSAQRAQSPQLSQRRGSNSPRCCAGPRCRPSMSALMSQPQLPSAEGVMRLLRVLLPSLLVLAAALLGFLSVQSRRDSDNAAFMSSYESAVDQAERALRTGIERKGNAVMTLSAGYAFEPGVPSIWPQFWAVSEGLNAAADARSVAIGPLIHEPEREAWEAFFRANGEAILGPDRALLAPADRAAALARLAAGPFDQPADSNRSLDVGYFRAQAVPTGGLAPFVSPLFQVAPLADVWAALMVNVNNETQNRLGLASYLATGRPHCSDVFNLVEDKVRGLWRPSSIVRVASYWEGGAGSGSSDGQQSRPVARVPTGISGVVFSWDTLLNQSVPSNIPGLVVLLRGPASLTTFALERGALTVASPGDVTAQLGGCRPPVERLRRRFTIRMGAAFDLDVFPMRCYHDAFHARSPNEESLLPVLVLAGIGVLFLGYDLATHGRIRQLAEREALAAAEGAQQRARHAFLQMVSHEIRTPSAAIAGAVEVLQREGAAPAQAELFDLIGAGVRQILQMVEDALAVGGPSSSSSSQQGGGAGAGAALHNDAFKLCPVLADPVRDILDRAVTTVRLDARLSARVAALRLTARAEGPAPPLVYVDAMRACQIVSNLLNNAFKYTERGSVHVRLRFAAEGEPPVSHPAAAAAALHRGAASVAVGSAAAPTTGGALCNAPSEARHAAEGAEDAAAAGGAGGSGQRRHLSTGSGGGGAKAPPALVSTGRRQPPRPSRRGVAVVTVTDTGPGLTREEMASLFEPFVRGSRSSSGVEGTGLGLTVCRRLARSMGGEVEVASEGAGKGCCFTATIPFLLPEEPPSHPSAPRPRVISTATGGGSLRPGSGSFAVGASGSWVRRGGAAEEEREADGRMRRRSSSVALVKMSTAEDDPPPPAAAAASVGLLPLRKGDAGTAGEGARAVPAPHPAAAALALAPDEEEPAAQQPPSRRIIHTPLPSVSPADIVPQLSNAPSPLRQLGADNAPTALPLHSTELSASGTAAPATADARQQSSSASALSELDDKAAHRALMEKSPSVPSALVSRTRAPPPSAPPWPPIRCIMADDCSLIRQVMGRTLALAGFAPVEVYPDGVQASAALFRDPHGPRCVFLDQNMGGGELDGVRTALRIESHFAALGAEPPPVVMVSGETDPAVHRFFLASGAKRVLVKPATVPDFLRLRELVLSHPAAGTED